MTDTEFKRYIRSLVTDALRFYPTNRRTHQPDYPLEEKTDAQLRQELIHRLAENIAVEAGVIEQMVTGTLPEKRDEDWSEDFLVLIHMIRCLQELKRRAETPADASNDRDAL